MGRFFDEEDGLGHRETNDTSNDGREGEGDLVEEGRTGVASRGLVRSSVGGSS